MWDNVFCSLDFNTFLYSSLFFSLQGHKHSHAIFCGRDGGSQVDSIQWQRLWRRGTHRRWHCQHFLLLHLKYIFQSAYSAKPKHPIASRWSVCLFVLLYVHMCAFHFFEKCVWRVCGCATVSVTCVWLCNCECAWRACMTRVCTFVCVFMYFVCALCMCIYMVCDIYMCNVSIAHFHRLTYQLIFSSTSHAPSSTEDDAPSFSMERCVLCRRFAHWSALKVPDCTW